MSSTLPRAHGRAKQSVVLNGGLSRPASLYDNVNATLRRGHSTDVHTALTAPSQYEQVNTTVPMAVITPPRLSRHTPTRNSLRHSKLITINKATPGRGEYQNQTTSATIVDFLQ